MSRTIVTRSDFSTPKTCWAFSWPELLPITKRSSEHSRWTRAAVRIPAPSSTTAATDPCRTPEKRIRDPRISPRICVELISQKSLRQGFSTVISRANFSCFFRRYFSWENLVLERNAELFIADSAARECPEWSSTCMLRDVPPSDIASSSTLSSSVSSSYTPRSSLFWVRTQPLLIAV